MINLSQASLDLIFALKPPGLSLVMINLLLSCGRVDEVTEIIQKYTKQVTEETNETDHTGV